jgi:uncharacterized protein YeaO (DUF488 family)
MLMGLKRIYEKPDITDGKRILVDRLWPRGVKRSTANVDLWLKAVAPSDELRQWFAHDPEKWKEFQAKYKKELDGSKPLKELVHLVKTTDVTILYAAKDPEHNNAIVLAGIIEERINHPGHEDEQESKSRGSKAS